MLIAKDKPPCVIYLCAGWWAPQKAKWVKYSTTWDRKQRSCFVIVCWFCDEASLLPSSWLGKAIDLRLVTNTQSSVPCLPSSCGYKCELPCALKNLWLLKYVYLYFLKYKTKTRQTKQQMYLKVEMVFVIWSTQSWSLLIQEKLPVHQSSDIYHGV